PAEPQGHDAIGNQDFVRHRGWRWRRGARSPQPEVGDVDRQDAVVGRRPFGAAADFVHTLEEDLAVAVWSFGHVADQPGRARVRTGNGDRVDLGRCPERNGVPVGAWLIDDTQVAW